MTGRTLVWNAPSGAFSLPANWTDLSGNPVATGPGNADIADFVGNAGTVTGSGTAAEIVADSGSLVIAGTLRSVYPLWLGSNFSGLAGAVSATIASGGTVTAAGAQIGDGSSLLVDAGRLNATGGSLIVGGVFGTIAGAGALAVTDAGTVTAGAAPFAGMSVGTSYGGSSGGDQPNPPEPGTVSVSGAGSRLSVAGTVAVVNGTLAVSGGATLSASNAGFGGASPGFQVIGGGGPAAVSVQDPGSTISVVGAIQVVNASLSVSGGAALSARAPASTRDLAGVTLDGSISAQGSIGALSVTGPGSSFTSNEGPFIVGNTGTGVLTISGGGTVTASSTLGVFVGQSLGATGVVTVTEPNSTFLMTAALSVGGNTWVGPNLNYGGSGTVSVLNGATLGVLGTPVVSGGVTIIAGAVLTLGAVPATGGTVQGAGFLTLDATSHVEIGGDGSLSPAGTLLVDAGNTLNGYGQVDGPIEAFGSIDASSGYLQLGTVASSNTLGIEAGATLGVDALSFGVVKFNALQGTLRVADLADFSGSIAMGNFGGTINLPGVSPGAASFSDSVLSVDSGGVVSSATLTGLPAAPISIISDDGEGGTNVVIACFVAGARILTPEGERAVETLRPDDVVVALSGRGRGLRLVTWVGARQIDIGRHAAPWLVAPVRICAGAFADGVPHRDLLLSPDHAVRLRDAAGAALAPVHAFVNGASIAQERHSGIVSYWHVELAAHDLVLAEGLAVESFLDTGNRAAFGLAGGAAVDLHPDFSPRRWDEAACAPLLLGGPRVAALHAGLLARAQAMGFALGRDAGLTVEVDGRRLAPVRMSNGTLHLRLPRGGRTIRLRSRHAVPWLLNLGVDDRRCLGIAVAAVALDGMPAALEGKVFGDGFFPVERDGSGAWRWTGGEATLLLPVGVREVTLRLRDFWLRYWARTAA